MIKDYKTIVKSKCISRNAFTLAEVLITLGIIGVVAAMTIPTLMASYQKKVYITQLKKMYSTTTQAFTKYMADSGVSNLQDTLLFGEHSPYSEFTDDEKKEIKKIFNVSSIYTKATEIPIGLKPQVSWKLDGSESSDLVTGDGENLITLSDGSYIVFNYIYAGIPETNVNYAKTRGGKLEKLFVCITFDVNGYKKPNIVGRDIHQFFVNYHGLLIPPNGRDYQLLANMRNVTDAIYKECDPDVSNSSASNCTARIIEYDNWEMKY